MAIKAIADPVCDAGHDSEPSVSSLVVDFTRGLFPGDVTIRPESDPEFPSDYSVVSVVASGNVDELLLLNDRWHREIHAVAGEAADKYRLSLDVQ